jgi:hypothetical protein
MRRRVWPLHLEVIGWTEKFGQLQFWSAAMCRRFRKRGRVGALQIAWPNELSNTRYSNFFDRLVEQMQQKSGQKILIFF